MQAPSHSSQDQSAELNTCSRPRWSGRLHRCPGPWSSPAGPWRRPTQWSPPVSVGLSCRRASCRAGGSGWRPEGESDDRWENYRENCKFLARIPPPRLRLQDSCRRQGTQGSREQCNREPLGSVTPLEQQCWVGSDGSQSAAQSLECAKPKRRACRNGTLVGKKKVLGSHVPKCVERAWGNMLLVV